MNIKDLKNEILFKENILTNPEEILAKIKKNIIWDNSIVSRKTASFGIPYNYSNITYKTIEIPEFLLEFVQIVKKINGFEPNNCLLNYYFENSSKMGFHSDQIDILDKKTGVSIFSLGSNRIIRFKNKLKSNVVFDILLLDNSYLFMSQKIQLEWLHSILPDKSEDFNERISLTFRKLNV